jgi:hypothetical protein
VLVAGRRLEEPLLARRGSTTSWAADRIRAAGYDLVIARDDLQLPDPSDRDATSGPGSSTWKVDLEEEEALGAKNAAMIGRR